MKRAAIEVNLLNKPIKLLSDAVSPSFRKMTVSRILSANVESTIELTVHTA